MSLVFLQDDLTEPILHARLSGEQNQLETGVGLSETERGGDPATQQPVTTCRYNPEDIWAERRQGKSGHATEARFIGVNKGYNWYNRCNISVVLTNPGSVKTRSANENTPVKHDEIQSLCMPGGLPAKNGKDHDKAPLQDC